MKLANLQEHKAKHAESDEIPALEYESQEFSQHVRELYQEIKPRPDEEAAALQWDREVAALINAGECSIGGVRIRRI